MVKRKSADSGKYFCSVYIFVGEGVSFLFFVCFLVHFPLFGSQENGRNEMIVQLHQYIYAKIAPRLGCSGFERDKNYGEEEICRLW